MKPPTDLFANLTIIELASVLAGPAVGMFFAELGAKVIKIENARTGGDVTRRWKAPGQKSDSPDSPYYHSINYGKQSHQLDLRQASDQQKVYQWIKEADVVISNFRPASAKKLSMDYQSLKSLNPQLIYAELTGYGPEQDRPAFDVVLQAETGFMHMTGYPDQAPAKMPVALIDLLAAHQLKEGILCALWRRATSGQGAYVQASLYHAALSSLANQAANWLMAGHSPGRMGSQHPNIAPYGDLFYCADDKEVVLAVGTEGHFAALCQALKLESILDDPRFSQNANRLIHRSALIEILQPVIAQFSRAELLALLEQCTVPAGAVLDLPEIFDQPTAQSMILRQTLPDGRESKVVRTVVFQLN